MTGGNIQCRFCCVYNVWVSYHIRDIAIDGIYLREIKGGKMSEFSQKPLDITEHTFYNINKPGAINFKPGVSPEHGSAVRPFDKMSTYTNGFYLFGNLERG
jgi:hypothetical protein